MTRNKRGARGASDARLRAVSSENRISGRGSTLGPLKDLLAPKHGASGFTLRDEARNTAKVHADWDKTLNLRGRPVVFVDGGLVTPLEDLAVDDTAIERDASKAEVEGTLDPVTESVESGRIPSMATVLTRESLGVDEQSDSHSDSSEEVIVFQGRSRPQNPGSESDFTLREIRLQIDAVNPTAPVSQTSGAQGMIETPNRNVPCYDHLISRRDDEEAILADYIANITDDDMHTTLQRDLGGSDDELRIGGDSDESAGTGTDGAAQDGRVDDLAANGDETDGPEMTDQQMARLLAKQEELGLGGEELLLFDDDGTGARGASRKESDAWDGMLAGGFGGSRDSYPSAAAIADTAEEFDLMDWGRPSLRNKNGRKKGGPFFDISDSEIEANLKAAWQQDRFKKQEKRRARETLRAAGLLNKHADAADLRPKYFGGMTLDDVKAEIRAFLLNSNDSLALPPMDANSRKVVHEIANRFKIKSKSKGSGDQRQPVLHRTRNTVKYTEMHFEQAMARTQRRNFGRPAKISDLGTRSGAGSGGRVNHAAVTVRDGEVVGGSAPEIGTANKGRRLLEKMGWSSGDALGAVDNKGRTEPIEHIVKRSRAGLG